MCINCSVQLSDSSTAISTSQNTLEQVVMCLVVTQAGIESTLCIPPPHIHIHTCSKSSKVEELMALKNVFSFFFRSQSSACSYWSSQERQWLSRSHRFTQQTAKKVIHEFCLALAVMIAAILMLALEKIIRQLLQWLRPPIGLILSTILMLCPE